jgi:hypothetical protein
MKKGSMPSESVRASRAPLETASGMEPAREAYGARLERRALVIVGDQGARRLLDRGIDRGDPVMLDDIVAQRRSDHPDQFVLELGWELDLAHGRFLEAIEAAAAGDDQLHRFGGNLLIGIADEPVEQFIAAPAPGVCAFE